MSKSELIWVTKELALADSPGGNVSFQPSDEHLKAINNYTLSPMVKEDVVAFPILAMNDSIDRDFDQFTLDCITRLATNKKETGPLGKPFLCSHSRSEMAKGRIYQSEIKQIGKITHLKLWVYIPNTEQYQPFIENLVYGVYWAVSVGVGTDKTACNICGTSWPSHYNPECNNGHVKGSKIEGKIVNRQIGLVTELYELSSVYLGAQYGAEVAKKMANKEVGDKAVMVIKDAIHSVNQRDEEIIESNLPEEVHIDLEDKEWPEILALCIDAFQEGISDTWQDLEHKCHELDKEPPWRSEKIVTLVGEGAELEPMNDGSLKICKGSKVWLYDGNKIIRSEVKHVKDEIERLTKELEIKTEEFDAIDTQLKQIQDAHVEAKEFNVTLVKELEDVKGELESKSKIVDSYLGEMRAEVIKWYKLSKGVVEGEVDATFVTRLLDKCGDDPELLSELKEDFKSRAKEIMPSEVRRSSAEDGAGIEDKEVEPESDDDSIADSIHS